ncbi:MAG TPA: SCO family protein [Steroidobacter sp.]|uniref:SCO family protein n=1 Tax=Steroidobacter sp. TaxID=1978227 RepID=UPI002ED986FD
MSQAKSIGLAAVVAIVAIAAGILLARAVLDRSDAPTLAKATLIDPARPLPPMAFIDQEGKPFGPEQLRGHWSILFFGFTFCPDICPTTLALLAQVEKQLADLPQEQRPHIVLVSVDPKRDTPERLAQYVKSFSPSFTGITGEQEAVHEFALKMGVPVQISPLPGGNYTVDHSAAIFVVDPNGALRALSSTPHQVPIIAEDYRSIVAASPHS